MAEEPDRGRGPVELDADGVEPVIGPTAARALLRLLLDAQDEE